ncbi:SDR family oxidoreductase [Piscicoccus intestinalis]|uniref:SDR family oxidoreductase n=1 Tax=Piscicoccus intestinalis TaxID=746033 RepID=UPI00083881E3|nr:SDR family oxidoreductase [Piscicoccus intestinalis]
MSELDTRRPDPRAVIVTAGAAGIGRSIAAAFAQAGDRVHICDIDEAALTAATAELTAAGGTVSGQVCDVSDEEAVRAFVADAAQRLGGIDVVVNNAGIAGPTCLVEEMALADWQRVLDVNLTGHFLVTRESIRHLKRSESGSLVFISSLGGRHGYPRRAPYAVVKRGILALVETLAMELGEHGIRVNAIAPGLVDGERIQQVMAGRAQAAGVGVEEVTAQALALQSLKYMVDPADIGALAYFLSSPAARSISGQTIGIDGASRSIA